MQKQHYLKALSYKQRLFSLFLPCLLLISLFTNIANGAAILLYHRFGEPKYPSTNTSVNTFKNQMAYLKTNEYNVIKLSRLCSMVKSHKFIAANDVAITIDDGFKSTLKAVKILKKYHFPATIFLYTDAYSGWPAFLRWKEINQIIKDPMFDIGNHTAAHSRLDSLTKAQVTAQIDSAQISIKEHTGKYAALFAYPYGDYNKSTVNIAKKLGFNCVFSQDVGAVDGQTNPYLIPRIAMTGKDPKLKRFIRKLNILPLHLKSFSPKEKISGGDIIKVILKNPSDYSNVQIYISEYGWIKTDYNKLSGKADAIVAKITRYRQRIVVKAIQKSNGKSAYFTWMIHKK